MSKETDETETLAVTCQLCKDPNNPVLAVVPAEGGVAREEIEWVARNCAVHNDCMDRHQNQLKAALIQAEHKKRLDDWEKMCPREFRKEINIKAKGFNEAKMDAVLKWEYGETGLLLRGASGKCKTRFAWLILKRELDKGRSVMGLTHAEFRHQLTALAASDGKAAMNYLLSLAKVDLLLLDDLGKGRRTPASEEALFMLINARNEACHPTIYTMNMTMTAFGAQCADDYREPLVSRITSKTEEILFR